MIKQTIGSILLYYFIMQEDNNMMKVFVEKDVKEMQVQLSDGRMISLEEVLEDYERLLMEKEPIAKLEVGKWFFYDRDVIDKNREKILNVCGEKKDREGRLYWERFEESNKIADAEPERYPRQGWTYVFKHDWDYKKGQKMRDMCNEIGDGMCDEVICDFELQMRICNGETAEDLFEKADKLPQVRVIQLRDGETGFFGGGTDCNNVAPPAALVRDFYIPDFRYFDYTPYAFRRKLS